MELKKKINGVIHIPSSLKGSFFRYWLEFLSPFHDLSPREMDVAACFLKQRYILSQAITDNNLLDDIVMSQETKKKIIQECNISTAHFQMVMSKLRKSKIIINDKLNPKFVPKGMSEGDKSFQLLLYFDLDEGNSEGSSQEA